VGDFVLKRGESIDARNVLGIVARNAGLLSIGALFLLPMLWMFAAAFDAHASFTLHLPALTVSNFRHDLKDSSITLVPLRNSLLLAGGATVLTTASGLSAAYALSRYRMPLRRSLLLLVLFATGLPVEVMMIPAYSLFVTFNLLDSIPATIVFLSATSLPFAIWILKNFVDQIPVEIEEAAHVDGAGVLERIWRHVLPLAAPGIAVAALFTFMTAWGQFVIPYILLESPHKAPASVAIYQFLTAFGRVQYGPLAAFALMFSLPVLSVYWVLSRHIVGAFSFGGAVKG
jgi:multiple sugar transport system permease protein